MKLIGKLALAQGTVEDLTIQGVTTLDSGARTNTLVIYTGESLDKGLYWKTSIGWELLVGLPKLNTACDAVDGVVLATPNDAATRMKSIFLNDDYKSTVTSVHTLNRNNTIFEARPSASINLSASAQALTWGNLVQGSTTYYVRQSSNTQVVVQQAGTYQIRYNIQLDCTGALTTGTVKGYIGIGSSPVLQPTSVSYAYGNASSTVSIIGESVLTLAAASIITIQALRTQGSSTFATIAGESSLSIRRVMV